MSVSSHRRRWLVLSGLLVAVVVGLLGLIPWGDEEASEAARGPQGEAFYEPSADEVAAGEHGTVIWSRAIGTASEGAGSSHLVLYRSTSAKGETVPVSGVVTVPTGPPPEGGWPVVSWGHGTTGTADACAPTRSGTDPDGAEYVPVREDATADFVERGYAVVRSDYEGLGTPGPHPYLMGQSAGASMADIVTAARELEPDLSPRWVAIGHSQGAHAALFTSRFTGAYTPGLELLGIVALAPPSQLGAVVGMLDTPEQDGDGQDVGDLGAASSSVFLGPLVVSGARTAGVPVEEVVSDRGRALLPHLEQRCLGGLGKEDSLGGIAPRDFLDSRADLSRIEDVVGTNDPSALNPTVPVQIVQGGRDEAVPSSLTDRLVGQLEDRGTDVDHVRKPRASHMSVLGEGADEVQAWVEAAFDG